MWVVFELIHQKMHWLKWDICAKLKGKLSFLLKFRANLKKLLGVCRLLLFKVWWLQQIVRVEQSQLQRKKYISQWLWPQYWKGWCRILYSWPARDTYRELVSKRERERKVLPVPVVHAGGLQVQRAFPHCRSTSLDCRHTCFLQLFFLCRYQN